MAEPVNFTKPAAERIARAVRAVEFGDRESGALGWQRPWGETVPLKLGYYTGDWEINTFKTVYMTQSGETATVYNWCASTFDAPAGTSCYRHVIFSNVRGTNSAVELQLHATCHTCITAIGGLLMSTLLDYDPTKIQLLGHSDSEPCLRWYSVTTCA